MLRYFSAVQPSKTEADVDFALDNYDKPGSGGWPKMYADAINRFGPDPYQRTNSTTITTQQQGGTQWRNRLVSIYARYAPHKMDSVDQDLAAMQGNEENALRQLEEKYASLDAAHQTVSVNQQPSYNTVVIQNDSVSPPMVGIPSRTESVAIPQITITNNDGVSSVQRQNYQNVQPQPEPQPQPQYTTAPVVHYPIMQRPSPPQHVEVAQQPVEVEHQPIYISPAVSVVRPRPPSPPQTITVVDAPTTFIKSAVSRPQSPARGISDAELIRLNREIYILKEQVEDRDRELRLLRDEKEMLQSVTNLHSGYQVEYKSRVSTLEMKNKELKAELEAKTVEFDASTREKIALKKQVQVNEQELAGLEDQVAELEEYRVVVNQVKQETVDLKAHISTLEDTIADKTAALEGEIQKYEMLYSEQLTLESESRMLKDRIVNLEASLSAAQERGDPSKQALEKANQMIERLNMEMVTKDSDVKRMQFEHSSMQDLVKRLTEQVSEYERRIDELNEKYENQISASEERHRQEYATISLSLDQKDRELREMRAQLDYKSRKAAGQLLDAASELDRVSAERDDLYARLQAYLNAEPAVRERMSTTTQVIDLYNADATQSSTTQHKTVTMRGDSRTGTLVMQPPSPLRVRTTGDSALLHTSASGTVYELVPVKQNHATPPPMQQYGKSRQ